MFKNPLKYQQGGQLNEQQQQMLAAFIDWLPKRVKEFQGMQPDAIVQALDGMSKTPEGQKQVQQLMEQFQKESQSVPSAKRGGKIQDFICKHGRGGVAGCDCEKPVEKHQQENGKGRGIIGALSGLYNRFIGQRMPDVPGVNNRRVRTWTDANGIQHIVEDANVNGYSTVTRFDINGADSTGVQNITTGDGRVRVVNLQPGTPNWRSAASRTISQQENGGKVEKTQEGSVLDYYSNKWDNDLSRIKSGWNRFKESAPGKVLRNFMPNPNSENGMIGAFTPGTTFVTRIPKQKPTIIISENLGNGKFSAIDDFGRSIIYDAERDKGLFQVIDKNDVIWKPGKDWDIDKLYGQSLPMIEPIQYDLSKLGRITMSWPEFIGTTVLKWAPGIVGSAAIGSYFASKKDNKNSGGGSR